MENRSTKILVVEDDDNLGKMLSDYLSVKGFDVTLKRDGEEGLKGFIENEVDLCLLDVMMPKKDGFTLAKEIRGLKSSVPILFLSAKSMEEDMKEGFQSGADDYITKPFSMEVLMMRIEAILRRVNRIKDDMLQKKEFEINDYLFLPERQLIKIGDSEKKLTSKENELLRLLCIYMGTVVERNDALKMVWGDDNYFNSRSMDVYITKLRKLFKEDDSIKIINSHGKGFKLTVE